MKAISLWQPWASAIALGAKRIETRSWDTRHRGPVAIHAAKRTHELREIFVDYRCLYRELRAPFSEFHGQKLGDVFPLGSIVATAELLDCVRVEDLDPEALDEVKRNKNNEPWTERDFGNYSSGRFGWVLDNIKALDKPIPYRGRQRLFEVPDELVMSGFTNV